MIALITGITGMDGSLMADLLLEKGYQVHGIIRRCSNFNTQRIDHIFNRLILHYGDMTDAMALFNVINKIKPNEIYNFAAQSHVKVSEELENYTFQTNTIGVLNLLQSVRNSGLTSTCKIYNASTSEMFGNETNGTQMLSEESPMHPVSIYGISKLAAQQLCNMYRNAYKMFIVSSVLFNHENERRAPTFVTQKIAMHVAKYNNSQILTLGNLDARRDWGNSKEYVQGIYLMMQHPQPDNYVLATGETHSVREFAELAYKEVGIQLKWIGKGIDEVGIDIKNENILVKVDSKYFRPIDIECLIGDATKAKQILGWKHETTFSQLVSEMVKAQLDDVSRLK
jgi:GDPmannose 4,6-dehydratase